MNPPKRPVSGSPIPDNWFADFYDYVRTLEAHGDQKTTIVNRNNGGTFISVIPKSAAASTGSATGGAAEVLSATVISGSTVTGYVCRITRPDGTTFTDTVFPAFLSFDSTLPAGYTFLVVQTSTPVAEG